VLWPVVLGAVLPDLPIFTFYAYEKLVLHVPEGQVWRVDYFASAWQPVIDGLHSFVLIGLLLVVAWRLRLPRTLAFAASLFLHSLCDFPVHHDDAHRHFFPLSDWRFRSPISYWDPRHHGALGAALEVLSVWGALLALARRHRSVWARAAFGLTAVLYGAAWFAAYARS
jgi:hypothetical protein